MQILSQAEKMQALSRYEIRWLSRAGEIPVDLWETCFPPPLEGLWWYEALERSGLDSQFEFFYGLIERDGRPLGIAPAFLMNLPLELVAPQPAARLLPWLPGLRYQRTLFAGSPCAEEGTVGLMPGTTLAEVAPAIQDALDTLAHQREARLIVWKDFPGPSCDALEQLARNRGLFHVPSFPNTRMNFAGCASFEDYLKLLNNDKRWKLRKKLRLSHALGEMEEKITQRPTEAELDEMFALFWQTYTRGEVKFERLTPEFFRAMAQAESAWFFSLRDPHTGRLAAFKLSFLLGRRLVNKFIGLDYNYGGDWYLYFRLWETQVNWALRFGVEEMQNGQTCYAPKFDIGLSPVPLNNYCRHTNKLLNRLLARVARHISWSTLDKDLAVYVRAHQ